MSGEFSLDIKKMAYGGDGLGFHERLAVFVPMAVPGDKIGAQWLLKKQDHARATALRVIEPSSYREAPRCPIFGPSVSGSGCGGCQWQMMKYPYQLEAKRDILIESLGRIGRFKTSKINVEPCRGMDEPWHFRNKVQYPLARDANGQLRLGYYERGSHRIEDMDSCPVQLEMFDQILPKIKGLLSGSRYSIYDEKTCQGLWRHVCLRGSARTGELLIVLVARENVGAEFAVPLVNLGLGGLKGIVVNVNPAKTNVIYGSQSTAIWGKPFYHEKILDRTFRISAASFFQTNTVQAEQMVEDILTSVPKRLSTVVDAFSGVGLFALFLAQRSKKVVAIEENPGSRDDAIVNAKLNGIKGIDWICAKTEKAIKHIGSQLDLVVLDPPRQGVAPSALGALIGRPPKQLIYVSCDPVTLARDLRILVDGAFEVVRVAPFDLFPHTYHLETVVYLKHRRST
ncbi:MAG: 23S rRNA (uracil(1939)-C(5))-methyltransferase RlmD [Elusimicrobia bacterium]|nr:23S rRNA (uracil(1939)-C(5))-methyltransferase RlmD [Elusimicrobiota bacterium]